jgi:hypothetical protein
VVRRRPSVAGLAVLIAALSVTLVVVTALPIRSCPTCKGIAKKFADPESGTVPVRIGCPECGDRGSVTEPRRWKGSLVASQVTRLLQCWREERKKDFVPSFFHLAQLSGRDPEEVLGSKAFGGQWSGGALFTKSEGKDFVLVLLHGSERRWNGLEGLVLLGTDGRILDTLHCAGLNGWWLHLDLLERPAGDESVASITVQRMVPAEEAGLEAVRTSLDGAGRSFPAQPGADNKSWLVRVKGARFEIVSAPKN